MTKSGRYNFPITDEQFCVLHTDAGVRSIAGESRLRKLMDALREDGNDVSGVEAEIAAYENYVKSITQKHKDIVCHLKYLLNVVD